MYFVSKIIWEKYYWTHTKFTGKYRNASITRTISVLLANGVFWNTISKKIFSPILCITTESLKHYCMENILQPQFLLNLQNIPNMHCQQNNLRNILLYSFKILWQVCKFTSITETISGLLANGTYVGYVYTSAKYLCKNWC